MIIQIFTMMSSAVSPKPIEGAGDFEANFSKGLTNITNWAMGIVFSIALLYGIFLGIRWFAANPQTKAQIEEQAKKVALVVIIIVLLASLINWLSGMFS